MRYSIQKHTKESRNKKWWVEQHKNEVWLVNIGGLTNVLCCVTSLHKASPAVVHH